MLNIADIQAVGIILDIVGVAIIVIGFAISTMTVALHFHRKIRGVKLYNDYRKDLARSILLGLEFLVAGDIIRTVTTTVSLTSILALAGIVLIRTFLSIEFEMEITGKFPWQRKVKSIKKRKSSRNFLSKSK